MMVMIVVVIAMCSLALARPDGAGQCYLYDNLNGNGFVGMADRPRNGTNTVTVEPSTAKAGDRVTITVQVSGGDEIVGILGTVYEIVNAGGVGVIQDGKHTPGEGMKLCEDRGPVDYAVTHAAPFVGKTSIAWNYTLWATAGQAGGMLQVRVVTLNGKKGDVASQKFALGFATIAVFGRSTMPGTVQTMVSGAPQTPSPTTVSVQSGTSTSTMLGTTSAPSSDASSILLTSGVVALALTLFASHTN